MPRCWMCLSTEPTGAKKHSLMDLKESGIPSLLSMSTLLSHRGKMPCGSVLAFKSKVATAVLWYQPYLYRIVNSMRNTSSSLQFEWTWNYLPSRTSKILSRCILCFFTSCSLIPYSNSERKRLLNSSTSLRESWQMVQRSSFSTSQLPSKWVDQSMWSPRQRQKKFWTCLNKESPSISSRQPKGVATTLSEKFLTRILARKQSMMQSTL